MKYRYRDRRGKRQYVPLNQIQDPLKATIPINNKVTGWKCLITWSPLESEYLNKVRIHPLIRSTYLGIFIGDLVSSPAAASDLLDHQLSVRRQEMCKNKTDRVH